MPTIRDVMDTVAERRGDGPVNAELYGDLAPLWDFEKARLRDHDAVADFVVSHAPAEARSVAVGACGTGLLCSRLADRFDRVVGVDAAPRMLDLAAGRTDADLVLADLRTVAAPGAFDVFTILGGSIAHLPAAPDGGDSDDGTEPRDAVRTVFESVYESLRPGGVLLCDFMRRGALESGHVTEDTFDSDRFDVRRTVVTTGEDRGTDTLGAAARYTFAYEMTDRENGETVRVGTSSPVREFGVPQLLGAAMNAGFDEVSLVTPPTHGGGLVARRCE